MKYIKEIHSVLFAILSLGILYFLHHLPFNQLFIDPFSEAIKNHDVMDVAFSRFRTHTDPALFDSRILIINSGRTDRAKMAATINYLNRKPIAGIGIDIILDTVYQNHADTLLQQAIAKSGKVVLGYIFLEKASHLGADSLIFPNDFFQKQTNVGYVNLASNDKFSIRAFEPTRQFENKKGLSFAVALSKMADSTVVPLLEQRAHEKEWINFRRVQPGLRNMEFPINSDSVTHYAMVDMDRFLRDTNSLEEGYFKEKIILIGFCGEDEKSFSMNDRHFTPLNEQSTGRSRPDMYGVVVHANIISMLLNKDYVDDVPAKYVYLISFLIFLLNYWIFKRMMQHNFFFLVPLIRVVQLLQFVALFSLCVLLLVNWNTKLGFITIITAVVVSFELYEFYIHKVRNRLDPHIHHFFERYHHTSMELKRQFRNYIAKIKLRQRSNSKGQKK